MLIEMKVSALTIDPLTNTPIVILKDIDGKKAVPIWIGIFEASAIASKLEKVSFSRPMTHDLLQTILNVLNATVSRVEINDLKDSTFFANIYLMSDVGEIVVDSRPSDAIALALRTNAPIFVDEGVVEKSRKVDFGDKRADHDKLYRENLKDFLDHLSPEDFGKYKM